MAQIYVYSAPTHTGKTTRLESWISKIQSIDGILMPVINNKRYIKYISTGDLQQLESDSNNPDLVQTIGKYKFQTDVFEHAQNYLLSLIDKKLEWIIIDEIGFLELNGQGFEPAVTKLILDMNTKEATNILLVIRDYLKEDVLEYYKLDVNNIKDFESE
ncbi:MAG: nucleoside-triphosphatase [Calditrichaceae bacterium]